MWKTSRQDTIQCCNDMASFPKVKPLFHYSLLSRLFFFFWYFDSNAKAVQFATLRAHHHIHTYKHTISFYIPPFREDHSGVMTTKQLIRKYVGLKSFLKTTNTVR